MTMTRETREALQRWLESLPPEIVTKARELCVADGYDPDGRVSDYGESWMLYVQRAQEEAAAGAPSQPDKPESPDAQPKKRFFRAAAEALDRNGLFYMCFVLSVLLGVDIGADILGYGPQAYIGGPIGGILFYFLAPRGRQPDLEQDRPDLAAVDHAQPVRRPPPTPPAPDERRGATQEHRHRTGHRSRGHRRKH